MAAARPHATALTPLRRLAQGQPVQEGCHILRCSGSTYLDGAEARVAEILATASDIGSLSDEVALAARGWAQVYHLSASRANVLRPLRILPQAHVLDVGAGCGAITRYLGETCAIVDALEPVQARARVARLRTRDLANVEVFVGTINDLPTDAHYDLVVSVGVLEWAAEGASDLAPYQAFLDRLSMQLRPGGTLVLAIENRIGVKYLAGAPEDHSGRPWDSVEGYPRPVSARTFSRRELERMLTNAGLSSRFLSAFPDYKITRCLLSDALFTEAPALTWRIPQFPSPDWFGERSPAASEPELWATLVSAGLGPQFANSFVVLAHKGDPAPPLWPEEQLAAFYQPARRVRYACETRLIRDGTTLWFHRTRVAGDTPASTRSLQHIVSDSPYYDGRDLLEVMAHADDATLGRFLTDWVSLLNAEPPGSSIDLVPHNLILDNRGRLVAIDREWIDHSYTQEDVVKRGVILVATQLGARTPDERWPCDTVADLARYLGAKVGLDSDGAWINAAVQREATLQAEVVLHPDDSDRSAREMIAAALHRDLERSLRDMPLAERDQPRLAALQAQLQQTVTEREAQATHLEAEVSLQDAQIDRLEGSVRALADEVHAGEIRVAEGEIRAAEDAAALAQLNREISIIKGTKGWRALEKMRRRYRQVRRLGRPLRRLPCFRRAPR
jgi:SAM-dependent methyltransferase